MRKQLIIIRESKEAWKFTINIAGDKKTFYSDTEKEGEEIAAIMLGFKLG